MPGKKFKITPKHRRLVKAFLTNGNWAESCRVSGFSTKYAPELSKNPQITQLIRAGQEKAGLSDKALELKHVELMNCGERPVELGSLRLAYQVKKKIGSDEAPPPAILPSVTVRIEAVNGTKDTGRRLSTDAPARVSVRVDNQPR